MQTSSSNGIPKTIHPRPIRIPFASWIFSESVFVQRFCNSIFANNSLRKESRKEQSSLISAGVKSRCTFERIVSRRRIERRLIDLDLLTSGTGNFHFSAQFWQASRHPSGCPIPSSVTGLPSSRQRLAQIIFELTHRAQRLAYVLEKKNAILLVVAGPHRIFSIFPQSLGAPFRPRIKVLSGGASARDRFDRGLYLGGNKSIFNDKRHH